MAALKRGQAVSATHHRCQQVQCAFFVKGGCQKCDGCGSGPYEMKNDCARCIACEGEEGELRWGEEKKMKTGAGQQEKEVEVVKQWR